MLEHTLSQISLSFVGEGLEAPMFLGLYQERGEGAVSCGGSPSSPAAPRLRTRGESPSLDIRSLDCKGQGEREDFIAQCSERNLL